jgi:hypothetical protein
MTMPQRLILIATAMVLAAVIFYPPWDYTWDVAQTHRRKPATRSAIIDPPVPEINNPNAGVRVAWDRLSGEMAAIALCGGAAYAVLGLRRNT